MNRYVVVILGLFIVYGATVPIRLEIDCGSQETDTHLGLFKSKSLERPSRLDIESLCSVIRSTIPKSVKDGKFLLIGEPADQSRASDTQAPVFVDPPKGFLPKLRPLAPKGLPPKLGPKFRTPKIKVPKLTVPKLRSAGPIAAPKVGTRMHIPFSVKGRDREEESSAERMEKFKKGVQKMLHVVKVLGQIDQYVSERTRIVVDMLSKTFTE